MQSLEIPTAEVFEPLLYPARDKASYGGRGSGKSHFFAELMIDDSLREPGECGAGLNSVCIREVQKDLAQSSKRLIENKLSAMKLNEADGFKIFRDVIQTPGDGIIIFKGMNDYSADSIKSLEGFKRSMWEEAQTASQRSLMLLRPTIRSPGSERWWLWNPRRKSDPIEKMFRGEELPTGAKIIESNWRTNPWFTSELEQERQDCKRMTPDQYGHVWEGEYVSLVDGAYYAKSLRQAKEDNRICSVPIDPLMTIRLFVDIGGTGAKSDAFSIWVAQFIGHDIRVIDYYEAQGQPLSAHLDWLRSKGYDSDKAQFWLPHDGATNDKVYKVSYESALKDAGYAVTVVPNQGKGAANSRIEEVRRRFPAIWIDKENCQGGIDALGWYHEKRDANRNIGLGPDHDWSSHAADGFGLMCIVYRPPTSNFKRSTRKPALGVV